MSDDIVVSLCDLTGNFVECAEGNTHHDWCWRACRWCVDEEIRDAGGVRRSA